MSVSTISGPEFIPASQLLEEHERRKSMVRGSSSSEHLHQNGVVGVGVPVVNSYEKMAAGYPGGYQERFFLQEESTLCDSRTSLHSDSRKVRNVTQVWSSLGVCVCMSAPSIPPPPSFNMRHDLFFSFYRVCLEFREFLVYSAIFFLHGWQIFPRFALLWSLAAFDPQCSIWPILSSVILWMLMKIFLHGEHRPCPRRPRWISHQF